MREKFIWNTSKNLSVRASRIRNFTIDENHGHWFVTAWISNTETLRMGQFKSGEEAQEYLERLHSQIEELDD